LVTAVLFRFGLPADPELTSTLCEVCVEIGRDSDGLAMVEIRKDPSPVCGGPRVTFKLES